MSVAAVKGHIPEFYDASLLAGPQTCGYSVPRGPLRQPRQQQQQHHSSLGNLCQTSVSMPLTFIARVPKKKTPTNETTALRGISARAVFWEKQCHYCRIVINIWQGSSSGAAWQCPTEYLCTRQLKVNGNPTKTLTAIKNGWCRVSNLCLIHFPGSNNVLLPSWKKKSQREADKSAELWITPPMRRPKLMWQCKFCGHAAAELRNKMCVRVRKAVLWRLEKKRARWSKRRVFKQAPQLTFFNYG